MDVQVTAMALKHMDHTVVQMLGRIKRQIKSVGGTLDIAQFGTDPDYASKFLRDNLQSTDPTISALCQTINEKIGSCQTPARSVKPVAPEAVLESSEKDSVKAKYFMGARN